MGLRILSTSRFLKQNILKLIPLKYFSKDYIWNLALLAAVANNLKAIQQVTKAFLLANKVLYTVAELDIMFMYSPILKVIIVKLLNKEVAD